MSGLGKGETMKLTRIVLIFTAIAVCLHSSIAEDHGEHIRYPAGHAMIDIYGRDMTTAKDKAISRLDANDIGCATRAVKAVNKALTMVPEFQRFADTSGFAIQIDVNRYMNSSVKTQSMVHVDSKHVYVRAPVFLDVKMCEMHVEFADIIADQMRYFIRMYNVPTEARMEQDNALKQLDKELQQTSGLLEREPASYNFSP